MKRIIILIILILIISPAQAYMYTVVENREVDFNVFYMNISTDYPEKTIKDLINSEKSSNIIIDSWRKSENNNIIILGHLNDYSIKRNKLFNPWWNTSYDRAITYNITTYQGVFNISNQVNKSDRWVNTSDNKVITFWNQTNSAKTWFNLSNNTVCISYPCELQIDKYINDTNSFESVSEGNATFPYFNRDLNINYNGYDVTSVQKFTPPIELEFNETIYIWNAVYTGFGQPSTGCPAFAVFFQNPGGYAREGYINTACGATQYLSPDFGNTGTLPNNYKLEWYTGYLRARFNENTVASATSTSINSEIMSVNVHSLSASADAYILYMFVHPPITATVVQNSTSTQSPTPTPTPIPYLNQSQVQALIDESQGTNIIMGLLGGIVGAIIFLKKKRR